MLIAFLFWLQAAELVTVEGRVVDALTNQPIEKARIVLFRTDRPNSYSGMTFDHAPGGGDPGANTIAVETAPDGTFRIQVKSPVKFRLFSSAKGYVRNGMAFDEVVEYTWKAGGENKSIALKLMPEAGISGRVIDADTRQPVAGVAVQPWRWRQEGPSRALLPGGEKAVTDEQGRYLIKGLKPGSYSLQVTRGAGAKFDKPKPMENFKHDVRMGYGAQWYPGVETKDLAATVLLQGESSRDNDFFIKKRRLGVVRGKLIAPEGTGEIHVQLIETRVNRNSAGFTGVGSTKLAPGQEFEVEGLMPGTYTLFGRTSPANGKPDGGVLKFRVDEENVDGLELHVRPTAVVTGQVRIRGVEPKPGEDALPTNEMIVGLMALQRPGFMGNEDNKVSAKDGSFRIEGFLHDRYLASVGKPPAGYKVSRILMNGTEAAQGVVTLDPAAPELKMEIELERAVGTATVSVNDGIRQAEGATVVMLRGPFINDVVMWTVRRGTTDSEGRATITGLLPGTYRLIAYPKDSMWAEGARLEDHLREGQEVKIGETGGAVMVQTSVIAP